MRAILSDGANSADHQPIAVTALGRDPGADPARATSGDCVAALLPAATVGVFYFGLPALAVLVTSTGGCLVLEALFRRLARRAARVSNGSAALTGLLLGMGLPPAAPVWTIVTGCVVAISFARLRNVGHGFKPFHPVLVAQIFLLLAFPAQVTTWSPPVGFFADPPDAVSAATPLGDVRVELLEKGSASAAKRVSLADALVGRLPGCVGETSVLALALGGCFLLWRGVIAWQVPVAFLGSVAALAAVLSAIAPGRFPGAGFHLVTGGLALGALFIAADRATAPTTPPGRLVYGAGCGVLTWMLRSFGSYPEGTGFAILIMSACTPLIDHYTRPCDPE